MCSINTAIWTRDGEAMLSTIGIPGLILILAITLIIFGPKKLPEIGKATGQTLKEFKKSARELTSEEDDNTVIESKGTSSHQDQASPNTQQQ